MALLPQGTSMVLGIAVDTSIRPKLVRMFGAAAAVALLGLGSGLYATIIFGAPHFVFGSLMTNVLCCPACGYFGAKNRSKPLLSCFACCNGTWAVLSLLAVAASLFLSLHSHSFLAGEDYIHGMASCCKGKLSDCDFAMTDSCTCSFVNRFNDIISFQGGAKGDGSRTLTCPIYKKYCDGGDGGSWADGGDAITKHGECNYHCVDQATCALYIMLGCWFWFLSKLSPWH